MSEITYTGQRGYVPSQPKVGDGVPDTVFAGENAIMDPDGWRAYGGSQNMNESRPVSSPAYTISLTAGVAIGTCSGGATCKADFRVGQHVVANRRLYLIEKIPADDQLQLSPTPEVTAVGQTIYRVPVISSINRDRATLAAGNATLYRNAAIFALGDGPLYVNGAPFAPSLAATENLKVAYPVAAGGYASHSAGFSKPASPACTEVGGGTKALPVGSYWIAVARKRTGFRGYGSFSDPKVVPVTVVGNMIRVPLAAFATGEGQTAWVIAVSRISERTQERPDLWLVAETTTASGNYDFDFVDPQLIEKATYDNDAPPKAQYVFVLGGFLGVAGCGGPPDAGGLETTPGAEIAAAKPGNPEAFSIFARTPTDGGEIIVGIQVGELVGFVMTPNTMQVLSLTGGAINPFAIRQMWNSGSSHQYSGCIAGDIFYNFTGRGLQRTLGRDNYAPDDLFSVPVKSDFEAIVREREFTGYDPAGRVVVVFWSNARKGSGDGWQTLAWSFNTEFGQWNTPVVLGNGTDDFIVTSCANVGGQLFFTTSAGAVYRWDSGGGTIVGYLGFPFAGSASKHLKTVREVKATGNANGKLRIYKNLNVAGLRSGSAAPEKVLDQGGAGVSVSHRVWQPDQLCNSFGMRWDFSLPGGDPIMDQLHVEYVQHGGFSK